ncbi:MAG: DNA-directed DNA polymerase II small subunit [Candidatus Hadarchaeum sp.]|uniref:DNA-directed DNA polymerase II small subunit n=1 Tax=Candidatus Hadarchaeum sp. TaxID=2883567 RepID=UPI003D0E23AB
MDEGALVRKFIEAEMQLTQEALEKLRNNKDASVSVDRVILALKELENRPFLITGEIISEVLERQTHREEQAILPPVLPQPEPAKVEVTAEKRLPELSFTKFKPLAAEYAPRVKVVREVTGQSYGEGDISDFVSLFRDRYECIGSILKKRLDLNDAVPISSLRNLLDKQQVKVVGMVRDKRESAAGNIVLELEDLSGSVTALVFSSNKELVRKAGEVNTDEVIGVVASLKVDGRAPRLFVRDIIWPDIPIKHEVHRAEEPVCAALLSDLHVGSTQFFEDVFLKFLRWLRGESDDPDVGLAGTVKYLVIAGDIVDGIGVYPHQEEELLINDIFKQYDLAAKLLAQVPDHITIIISPGNHDAVRPSEPQPAIHKDIASGLYDLNSIMVGNPVRLSLHGVEFLVYHGRSFDDVISSIPGLNREEATPPMIKLLKKRHLAPIYGGRTLLSPEKKDYLVIDEIPDVFHCGHLHVFGYDRYRDVSVINSGTFQGMTNFMRQLGVRPTPGIVPIINLQTHEAAVKKFV